MIRLYGIKNCDSVRKAISFLKEKGLEFEFVDFKKSPIGCEKIDEWLKKIDINPLFNRRSGTYRSLKLKELSLDEAGMREWLCKENLLIKRPVIELDDGRLIVGFDPKSYQTIFN